MYRDGNRDKGRSDREDNPTRVRDKQNHKLFFHKALWFYAVEIVHSILETEGFHRNPTDVLEKNAGIPCKSVTGRFKSAR
jgi:hypothetical protein